MPKRPDTHWVSGLFASFGRDSKDKSQHAGGMLLPPVQKLVATLVFAKGENANESLPVRLVVYY